MRPRGQLSAQARWRAGGGPPEASGEDGAAAPSGQALLWEKTPKSPEYTALAEPTTDDTLPPKEEAWRQGADWETRNGGDI